MLVCVMAWYSTCLEPSPPQDNPHAALGMRRLDHDDCDVWDLWLTSTDVERVCFEIFCKMENGDICCSCCKCSAKW
jgi:hypothetical protein